MTDGCNKAKHGCYDGEEYMLPSTIVTLRYQPMTPPSNVAYSSTNTHYTKSISCFKESRWNQQKKSEEKCGPLKQISLKKHVKKTSINSEKQHATISTAGGLLPPFRRPSALDWQQPARRFPPTRMWWKWTPVADSSRGQTAAPPQRSTDKHSQMCHYVAIPLGNIFNKMYTASQGHNFRGSLHWRSERTL